MSALHSGITWQLPSTQRCPALQSASREHEPTNTQLPATHAQSEGQSESRAHIAVGTQRPPMHSTPLAAQSAVLVHSGGAMQRPSSQIIVGGQVISVGQRIGRSQKPKLHSMPGAQSASVRHDGGGSGTHAPSMQTGSVARHSASDVQPSGTMQRRERHTMRGKGQSSSRPQKSGGKQNDEMQRQPPAQSVSLEQRIGWQISPSQRSPVAHSESRLHS